MKILTLNTWQERGPWEERWKVTLEGLQRFRPDIVGFQELFNRSWAEEVQKRTGYSTLIFPEEGCGLALYARYPAKSWGVVTLSQSPLEEYSRYALWAELGVKRQKLFVLNTHFSWMPEDGESRKAQAEEVLSFIEEKASSAEWVLMGDLNASRHSPEIKQLTERGNFQDLFHKVHPFDSGFTWDNRNPYVAGAQHKLPDRRIDFILARETGPLFKNLVSCNLVFNRSDARGVWASDHFGVLAEFK